MKKNIILGVTGSIAAYKAADIANTLTKEGHSVHVIMTKAGMEFITPLTFETLTVNKCLTKNDEKDCSKFRGSPHFYGLINL